jgi:peptide/nickel transport system permease protein
VFKRKNIPNGSLSSIALASLLRNKTVIFSIVAIAIAILISILGYLITPDKTPFANDQHIEIAAKKPGFSTLMLKIRNNEPEIHQSFITTLLYGKRSNYETVAIGRYAFSNDSITIWAPGEISGSNDPGISYLLQDVVYALNENNKTTQQNVDIDGHPMETSVTKLREIVEDDHLLKKSFLLGTDRFGRDMLSQLMIGTRVSLSVGFISVLISLILGIFLGALAGFFRGKVDDLIIWFINVIWSVPTLLLVIAITFALGKGFWQVFIAVGLTMWVEVARVVRGQIISLREKEFVEAARALGYKNLRIIVKHILPNTFGPVIVISAANFASAILIEAGLSFLGIGVQPPMPSWGTMIKENYAYIILENPWLALIPGIAIMVLVLAFMLIGNGLRDALDVKTNTVM